MTRCVVTLLDVEPVDRFQLPDGTARMLTDPDGAHSRPAAETACASRPIYVPTLAREMTSLSANGARGRAGFSTSRPLGFHRHFRRGERRAAGDRTG